jgi:hypothetical protein
MDTLQAKPVQAMTPKEDSKELDEDGLSARLREMRKEIKGLIKRAREAPDG